MNDDEVTETLALAVAVALAAMVLVPLMLRAMLDAFRWGRGEPLA